jgi:ABC-2 type transport system ATP-binding protein
MRAVVETRNLVKCYRRSRVNAVDGISFTVSPGEIFGLLGPNGAGKTTTMGILTTRVRATAGEAYVGGVDVLRDPVRARAGLAVVPQQSSLDRSLTLRQNLTFHAAYHGLSRRERNHRADRLLDELGLADRAGEKVDRCSGGMAQRVMIARALMHDPKVLFLDEPTTGLDPQSRRSLWERIRDLRRAGRTVVLTTHDMDEAAELSDRVAIVDHGRLIALDTPAALIGGLNGRTVLDLAVVPGPGVPVEQLIEDLRAVDGVLGGERLPAGSAGTVRLYVTGRPAGLLGPVATRLHQGLATLLEMRVGEPGLEDVFFHLTGRGLR